MVLLYKQLTKEILKNKLFVFLMLLLTTFTAFMFFFVRFSIDGNIARLLALPSLEENQILYKNALSSNKILALNFLLGITLLTAFVFFMFFYRFFKTNKKQIGCLKSLGFKDQTICCYIMVFSVVLSLLGAIFGICGGYFASSILIHANEQSYSVTGLVRELNGISILTGILIPTITLCITSFFSYGYVRGKESGMLLVGIDNELKYSGKLRFANTLVNYLPIKNKSSLRIALRKPIALLLIVTAVLSFTIMFVLGFSLNASSGIVFQSQTEGHNYRYDTQYEDYITQENSDSDAQTYLSVTGTLSKNNNGKSENNEYINNENINNKNINNESNSENKIEQKIVGLEPGKSLLSFVNQDGKSLDLPQKESIYISPALQELNGFHDGDTLNVTINGQSYSFKVQVVFNATKNCVYISKDTLSNLLDLPSNSYNGVLSMNPQSNGGTVKTNNQKLEELKRSSVSNRSSAIINHVIGFVVGCILIYLALLLNFQDSTRDILILHLMGYKVKDIKKMLIDIYKPIIWVSFFLTLWIGILFVKSLQKSLSIQTGDYMPFHTNIEILVLIFIILNIIYNLVQATFHLGIKRVLKKEQVTEYIN